MTDLISREAAKLIATNRESHAKGETARACRGIAVAIDMLPAQAPAAKGNFIVAAVAENERKIGYRMRFVTAENEDEAIGGALRLFSELEPDWKFSAASALCVYAHPPATPCPCTLIEQDDDCPIGQPSLLCGVCSGTGNTTPDKVQALAAEMLRIASDLGEPEDPFAAWENLQSGNPPAQCCGSVKAAMIHTGRNETLRKCLLCGKTEGANDGE